MEYISNSPLETKNIAITLAGELRPGDVLCLYGNLGVGKTAFVQGLAAGLGIEGIVSSPTFTVVNCYEGRLPLFHFDVYRIADCDEMVEIGYEEYVYGDGVTVIEWPAMIRDILPDSRYDIQISKEDTEDENFRRIQIKKVEREI